MKTKHILTSALIVALASSTALAQTGRQLQTTGIPVDNGDGTSTQAIIDTFWDARCAGNIEITYNSAFLPNDASGGPLITAEETAAAIDAGLQRWTDNPVSFVNMGVANSTPLPGLLAGAPLLDFTNQAQFELPFTLIGFPPGVLAVSISQPLIADATFTPGDDIDGDGDSDVFDPEVEGVNVCTDIDDDGDTDFPAGDYLAGTILDNDVLFNNEFVWETTPTAAGGADIDAVSTHEYGHSHGLTHSTINQISDTDGTTATMFPSITITDPASEEGTRTPSSDDLSASAFIYPEGTDYEGAAALQAGDIPFKLAFAVLEGDITNAAGEPIVGAAVSAINRAGDTVAVTFSGEISTETFDNATGGSVSVDIDNGSYKLAVPAWEIYKLKIEALDGSPVDPGQINTETGLAGAFSTTVFPEETLDIRESSSETRRIIDLPVFARPLKFTKRYRYGRSLDFVLNEETSIENITPAGIAASVPTILAAAESFQFIEQFDRDTVLDSLGSGDLVVGVNIGTGTTLASATPVFSSVSLVTGTIDADTGAVTLGDAIKFGTFYNVTGQDGDATPLDFKIPSITALKLRHQLRQDPSAQLFLVVNMDDIPSVTSPLGAIIPFVRPTITGPESGTSFFTIDGSDVISTAGIFGVPVNWDMQIRTATPERRLRKY